MRSVVVDWLVGERNSKICKRIFNRWYGDFPEDFDEFDSPIDGDEEATRY